MKSIMKKALSIVFSLLLTASLFAQEKGLILSESFNGSSMPSGWSIMELGTTNWDISESSYAGGDNNEIMLQHNPTFNGISRLVSPAVDLTGKDKVVVSFKHYFDDYSGSHTIGIATTSDAGATWNVGWSETYNADGRYDIRQLIETPDIGHANVQFCIFYSGFSLNIDYWYFDDITVYNLENNDAELVSIDVNEYVTIGGVDAAFTVLNKSMVNITSLQVSYQFEGHDMVTQDFTTDLAPLASAALTFETPTILLSGLYPLTINIIKVNGNADDDASNNTLTKDISATLGSVQRIPMIEHFSSSTCSPCVNVNVLMHTLETNNPGEYTYTKYPMSWPGTGDPYFTLEGGTRSTFYDVPWVPYLVLDGVVQDAEVTQEAFDLQYAKSSIADIRGSFTVNGNQITVIADIMAYAQLNDVTAFISVNEKTTTGNVGSNGETEFHHIMMKMLENAQGNTISIAPGSYQRLQYTCDMSSTNVEDMNDLEVSVWLQDCSSHFIYNSRFLYEYAQHPYPVENLSLNQNGSSLTATWDAPQVAPDGYNVYFNGNLVAEGISDTHYTFDPHENYVIVEVCAVYGNMTSVRVAKEMIAAFGTPEASTSSCKIYPNPANDKVTISAENISNIVIYNALGQMVSRITTSGSNCDVSTGNLSDGIYLIDVCQTDGHHSMQKMMVAH